MKIYLLIWLILSFTIYISIIVSKYGVLKSISDSYYVMKYKVWFTLFIWNTGFSFILLGENALMFFAGAFLCFVGATPLFKEKYEGRIHTIGAVGGILLGFSSLIIDLKLLSLVLIYLIYFGVLRVGRFNNLTWWYEIGAFITMIVGLLISVV